VWKESEPFKTRSYAASVILHPSLRSLQFRPMQIRYTPSVEDAVSVQRIGGAAPSWAMFIFIVLLSLMSLVAMFLINHGFAVIGWSWLSLSVAMGIATYELPRVQLRRSFRATPSARGEIVLTISDKGTEASFATGRTRLDWGAYTRYKESAGFFLLYVSPARYSWIPKRAMSVQQIDELRSMLRDKIPAAK
jgi:hypothetical protein